ncbi:MAG: glycosyltransferase family 1 protein [Gemmataceae bacterium]|nr:glycosyltransferase family 1 protein [Gemmataceae bacterium]
MRVIINGVSALKPKTGVGHTTANLHRGLAALGTADRFWLYPGDLVGRVAARVLRRPSPPAPPRAAAGGGPAWRGVLTDLAKAAYREHFRTAARWGNFDLYHEPNFVPVRTHLPTVVTVHDLSVLLHPEWHPADRVAFHERHFRRGVMGADHVVVVSESVRGEMIDLLGLSPDRVTTVHNGIGGQFRPQPATAIAATRRKLGLPPRYLLAVGTIEPRKNIHTLLRAFCALPVEARAACPLVLAGGWGWKSGPERDLFETEARHRGAIHLGYVDDADLPSLYAGAAALLYPSFYEGFGLPPVEMLACGGGVIASTAAAVWEVVGGHALLLAPHDLDGWRDAMRRVATGADFLDEFRRGGEMHAGQFTWDLAARRTLGVYRQVLGVGAAQPITSPRLAA